MGKGLNGNIKKKKKKQNQKYLFLSIDLTVTSGRAFSRVTLSLYRLGDLRLSDGIKTSFSCNDN